jgi:hypothetical protein
LPEEKVTVKMPVERLKNAFSQHPGWLKPSLIVKVDIILLLLQPARQACRPAWHYYCPLRAHWFFSINPIGFVPI